MSSNNSQCHVDQDTKCELVKEAVLPFECTICTDTCTSRITCIVCSFSCCEKCFESYLLSKTAHDSTRLEDCCMSCRKIIPDHSLRMLLRPTFINNQYAAMIKERLQIEQTRRQPEYQILLELFREKVIAQHDFRKLRSFLRGHSNRHEILHDAEANSNKAEVEYDKALKAENVTELYAPLVEHCSQQECQGYFDGSGKCNICNLKICFICHQPEHSGDPCNPTDLASYQEIARTSKACPVCKTRISKIDGCDDMFCVHCKTGFDWGSGKPISSGNNSNPMSVQWSFQELINSLNLPAFMVHALNEEFLYDENEFAFQQIFGEWLCSAWGSPIAGQFHRTHIQMEKPLEDAVHMVCSFLQLYLQDHQDYFASYEPFHMKVRENVVKSLFENELPLQRLQSLLSDHKRHVYDEAMMPLYQKLSQNFAHWLVELIQSLSEGGASVSSSRGSATFVLDMTLLDHTQMVKQYKDMIRDFNFQALSIAERYSYSKLYAFAISSEEYVWSEVSTYDEFKRKEIAFYPEWCQSTGRLSGSRKRKR